MYLMHFMLIFALAKINFGQSAEIISTSNEVDLDASIETTTYSTLNEEVDLEPLDIPEYELYDFDDDFTSPRTTTIDRPDTFFLNSGNGMRLGEDDDEDEDVETNEAGNTKYDKQHNLLLYLMDLQLLPKIHVIDNPLRVAAIKFTSSMATRAPSKLQMLRNIMNGSERLRQRFSTEDLN